LRRDIEFGAYLFEHREQRVRGLRAVGRRVDANHGIARAEKEAIKNACRDATRVVGGMIGLQPDR
jgi:hypothetical protein